MEKTKSSFPCHAILTQKATLKCLKSWKTLVLWFFGIKLSCKQIMLEIKKSRWQVRPFCLRMTVETKKCATKNFWMAYPAILKKKFYIKINKLQHCKNKWRKKIAENYWRFQWNYEKNMLFTTFMNINKRSAR